MYPDLNPETAAPRSPTLLSDYTPPAWQAPDLALEFELEPEQTRVRARARFSRNPVASGDAPLVLNGESGAMKLLAITVDGRALAAGEYEIDESQHTLTLTGDLPDSFELELETEIAPVKNTALEGLYMSGGKFCTQCEAQGFRRIVYFLDRPDVMARYTTTVIGEKSKYPVLLSNGNPIEQPGFAERPAQSRLGRSFSETDLSLRVGRGGSGPDQRQLHDALGPRDRS